jgi:hypothetical protein
MINRICHLTIYTEPLAEAYRLRSEIETFLSNHLGCKVISSGRSCIDPACTDIEVRVKSRKTVVGLVAAARKTFKGCEIDAEMVA